MIFANSANPSDRNQNSVIEAGVVLYGTETYQCYPLIRFGLDHGDEIISIKTSCDCLAAEVVEYADVSGTQIKGLKLSFLNEASDGELRGFLMAAIVTLQLADQSSKEISVRFLHTSISNTGGSR